MEKQQLNGEMPLLSLNSASFSTLNSTAFQQPPRGTCCGATCGGRGRRGGVEMGRRSGVGRGRTWAYEWSRPLTTAANVTSHHHQQLQQQRFVGVNGLNAQQEEGREQRTDLRTTKRVNQLSESAGSGRETEGETRSTRTKTTEKRVHLNPQNGPGYSQNRHFRRHSREQVEKDEKNQRSAPKGESAKASEEGQIESQQQHISGYNFEEREFPALLSGASASSDVGRGDHSQQTEEVADEATNFSVLPPAVAQRTPFALDCGAVGTTSTQSPPGGVQLQFSAVVAGHGRRRATIGTTAESGRRAAGRGGARADQDGREGGSDEAQQQRSGTIGAAERSYAQMLKGPK
uniref:Uncharacterized protein n=1 Tax=Globodera rostochiensis TaxID=31243 RepID=A0A914GRL1_GLORO